MYRKTLLLGLMVMLMLAACTPAQPAEPTAAPTVAATETAPAAAAPAVTEAAAAVKIPADCEPYDLISDLFQAPRPDLPEVSADDWKIGPDDAMVKVIVYSDFQ